MKTLYHIKLKFDFYFLSGSGKKARCAYRGGRRGFWRRLTGPFEKRAGPSGRLKRPDGGRCAAANAAKIERPFSGGNAKRSRLKMAAAARPERPGAAPPPYRRNGLFTNYLLSSLLFLARIPNIVATATVANSTTAPAIIQGNLVLTF